MTSWVTFGCGSLSSAGCLLMGTGKRDFRLPLMPSTRFIWDALVRCRWCGGPVAPPSGQLRPNCR